MKNVQWLQVVNYNNYEVSNTGEVRNKKTGRILKQTMQNTGYKQVCLSNNGIRKTHSVHRLVIMAFNPINNHQLMDVNHKDYDKTNNNIENLEWTTRSENLLHGSGPNELRILESMLTNSIKKALHQWYDKLLNAKISKEVWTEEVVQNAIANATEIYLSKE